MGAVILRPKSLARRAINSLNTRLGTAETRFFLAKFTHNMALRKKSNRNLLLIYTMGKVGSSSLLKSLQERDSDYRIFQVHWLTSARLKRDEALYLSAARKCDDPRMETRFHPRYVWDGMHVRSCISPHGRSKLDSKPKIVTLVRDPVARNVSSFFQNLRLFFGLDYVTHMVERPADELVAELRQMYIDGYVNGSVEELHDADPRYWLDEELNSVFNVDVYKRPFPIERGYDIFDEPSAKVLLLRMEDIDRVAVRAINEYLGFDKFHLVRANVGRNKDYSRLYTEFRNGLSLPTGYLDQMYASRFAKHFYAADELEAFRRQWS